MQLGNNGTNLSSGNRSGLILVIILAILIIILLGILYFMKQRDLGEGIPGSTSQTQTEKHSIKELMELTSAPENNPDIKPNPALTALTSAPENDVFVKADPSLMENLTAPKN